MQRASSTSAPASVATSRSSSLLADTTDESWLDELFWDSSTVDLKLPPIATYKSHSDHDPNATSPSARDSDDDDDWKSQVTSSRRQKRNHRELVSDKESADNNVGEPYAKKAKPDPDTKTKARSKRKSDVQDKLSRRLDHISEAKLAKIASAPNKHITVMKRDMRHIPIPKNILTPLEHDEKVKKLGQKHVRHVAPVVMANLKTGRDLGGKMNKFDQQKARSEIKDHEMRKSEPFQKLEKWTDEKNETITWLSVPASNKYINTGKKMIPVADIVSKSPKYSEFTFVEEIVGINSRTKKEVVKAYKFKYEVLDDHQALLRTEIMMKQAKEGARQRKKDEDARQRAEVRRKCREQANMFSGRKAGKMV